MALKNGSVDLVKDVSWYYEEPTHIEIVYWAVERDGFKKAHHIRIPWRKLKASVERKYGGLTKRAVDRAKRGSKSKAGVRKSPRN